MWLKIVATCPVVNNKQHWLDNSFVSDKRQAITWTNDDLLLRLDASVPINQGGLSNQNVRLLMVDQIHAYQIQTTKNMVCSFTTSWK